MRRVLEPAFVIHSRPYRDNSLLVELFSREHGRVALVARGARASGKRRARAGCQSALLQPFVPLYCSWSGRGSLRTGNGCESRGPAFALHGPRGYCGLYVNELLSRLLHRDDPHPALFDCYERTLRGLAAEDGCEWPLRQFELSLLEELGYGFDLRCEGRTGAAVRVGAWYVYHSEFGLLAAPRAGGGVARFAGEDLLKISAGQNDDDSRRCAKRLMRAALATYLGGRPLKSRELFAAPP